MDSAGLEDGRWADLPKMAVMDEADCRRPVD
jgi:hypothetical protein